jgi:hypothetical protein
MSRDHNAGQSNNVVMGNKSFARPEQFKYLGTTPGNQNYIHNKLRANCSREMLAIIWCRMFYLPVCNPKI